MKAVLRQLLSFSLPLTVLIVVPWNLLDRHEISFHYGWPLSIIFLVAGMSLLVMCISLFIRRGRGTLAPWAPTQHLVVTGPYAFVRNPMIAGVLFVLIGETIFTLSISMAIWSFTFFLINHLYFVLFEEPGLRKRFGTSYEAYCRQVRRWLPRRTAYRPAS
ncbi:MAG: isoprenylcysteine carboxylmethyltransferase family protein [Cyclobacteriaceae bacterium]|nr:isoprenylcysteine carboxylmethyltransferase family protein [Cyclobacteriaceae bacterium]